MASLQGEGVNDLADFNPDSLATASDQAGKGLCPVWLGSAITAYRGVR